MSIRVTKPAINVREKLTELETPPIGGHGSQLMASKSIAESFETISAGRKNMVINGDMSICQRLALDNTNSVDGTYQTDRYRMWDNGGGTMAASWRADAPPGFKYSLKLNVSAEDSTIGSSDDKNMQHRMEGYMIRPLAWGTTGAKDASLSFWVKSSVTGHWGVALINNDQNRAFVAEYTIDQPNVWEYKTIFVPGCKDGTWVTDNGMGCKITWSLQGGSSKDGDPGTWNTGYYYQTNKQARFAETVDATWFITGIQLEVGKEATPFEHRPYGEELALCQRYYQKSYESATVPGTATNNGAVMHTLSVNQAYASPGSVKFPVQMRATPTMVIYSAQTGTAGKINCDATDGNGTAFGHSETGAFFSRSNDSGGTGSNVIARVQYTASAEL